jgi:drug/metabolite transporter (DMT)-like permease
MAAVTSTPTSVFRETNRFASLSPETRGFLLGASAAIIWGLYLALARQGVSSGLTPVDIAVFRFGTAGLIMLPWFVLSFGQIRDVGLWRALALAALAGPPFILFGVGGYLFAPLAHGAVIQPAIVTTASMVFAAVMLGDKPTKARFVGVSIIILGIAVIAGPGLFGGGALTPLGDAMFAVAGLFWAGFTVLSRRWSVAPMTSTAIVSVLSGAVMLPVGLLGVGFSHYAALPSSTLITQIVVQGVLTGVISVIAFTTAARLIGPARAAIFPALVPAAAMIIGIPVAGEIPTAIQIGGLALVSLGLLVAISVIKLQPLKRG